MKENNLKAKYIKPYIQTTISHDFSDKLKNLLNRHYNPICISSFYKQKALILDEENIFIPVIIDKSNDVIDFDIDRHRIFCSKQNFKILLENLLCLSIMMKSKIFMLPSSFVT